MNLAHDTIGCHGQTAQAKEKKIGPGPGGQSSACTWEKNMAPKTEIFDVVVRPEFLTSARVVYRKR